jgi:amicyanin
MSQQTVAVSITKNSAARKNLHQSYLPKVLRIKAGTTVTWTNDDNVMHTVTSGNGNTETPDNLIESGYLEQGESFSYTFNKVGTYNYYCIPHPLMQGTVIVESA